MISYDKGWQSDRLIIEPVTKGNRDQANTIYEELHAWRRDELDLSTPPFNDLMEKRVLPPGSFEEDFTVYLMRTKDTGESAGILALLHKWPDKKTLYIAMFYIDKKHQKLGYGSEIMDTLQDKADSNYKKLSIRVHRISTHPPTFFFNRGFKKKRRLPPDDLIIVKKL